MRKIDGPGSVDNRFRDYDPVRNPDGTVVTADFMNDVQDEILSIQDSFGVAESSGTNKYMLACIRGIAKQNSKELGELFYLDRYRPPAAFDKDNPDDFFPAICLDKIVKTVDIDIKNWPDLVPYLLAYKLSNLKVIKLESDGFSTTLTFKDDPKEISVLKRLKEDQQIFPDRSKWRTITTIVSTHFQSGTYLINRIEPTDRTVNFESYWSRDTREGEWDVEFSLHHTGRSNSEARLFQSSGRALMSESGDDSIMAGLRVRDQFQGHEHRYYREKFITGATLGQYKFIREGTSSPTKTLNIVEASHGAPRIGSTTRPNALGAHLYIWGRNYIA